MTRRISLNQQIEEIDRELAVRERMKKWGSMSESQCAYCIERLRAAKKTLCWLRDNQDLIRESCPELFNRGAAK